ADEARRSRRTIGCEWPCANLRPKGNAAGSVKLFCGITKTPGTRGSSETAETGRLGRKYRLTSEHEQEREIVPCQARHQHRDGKRAEIDPGYRSGDGGSNHRSPTVQER